MNNYQSVSKYLRHVATSFHEQPPTQFGHCFRDILFVFGASHQAQALSGTFVCTDATTNTQIAIIDNFFAILGFARRWLLVRRGFRFVDQFNGFYRTTLGAKAAQLTFVSISGYHIIRALVTPRERYPQRFQHETAARAAITNSVNACLRIRNTVNQTCIRGSLQDFQRLFTNYLSPHSIFHRVLREFAEMETSLGFMPTL